MPNRLMGFSAADDELHVTMDALWQSSLLQHMVHLYVGIFT